MLWRTLADRVYGYMPPCKHCCVYCARPSMQESIAVSLSAIPLLHLLAPVAALTIRLTLQFREAENIVFVMQASKMRLVASFRLTNLHVLFHWRIHFDPKFRANPSDDPQAS